MVDGSLYQGPLLGPAWDPAAPAEGYISTITALMTDGGRANPKDHEPPAERYADPEMAAGESFAKLLGITEVVKGKAAQGAATLGEVKSGPMIRQLEAMMGES